MYRTPATLPTTTHPTRWRRFLCWLTWHGWIRASLDAASFDEWVETWSCRHCGVGPEAVFPRVVAKHRAAIAERARQHNAELAAGWKYSDVMPAPQRPPPPASDAGGTR